MKPATNDYYDLWNSLTNYQRTHHSTRSLFIIHFGWAIPNEEALDVLVSAGPTLEIGAGLAYWAHLANSRGANVHPTDLHVTKHTTGKYAPYTHTKVERIGAVAAVKRYPLPTLFICWPPYDLHPLTTALTLFSGDTVIYVGESEFGCCGDAQMHTHFADKYEVAQRVAIPQWFNIHDELRVYKRR